MTRRVVMVMLWPVTWAPPGVDPGRWRAALAEDVIDRIATVEAADPAVAVPTADRPLAEALSWPGTRIYDLTTGTVNEALAAAAADGYEQAALVAADAPDLPGLVVGKLMRPLTTRTVAVAGLPDGPGLLGVATRLPVPDWLPEIDLDATVPAGVRAHAPHPREVAVTPVWRRLRGPADLATLDPAVDGWDATRLLLSAPG